MFIVKNLINKNYLNLIVANTLIYILIRGGGTKVSGHVKCELQVVLWLCSWIHEYELQESSYG